MKKKYIPGIIFLAILIPAFVIYYNYSIRKTDKILEELKKEYPSISIDEGINSVIVNVNHGDPKILRNNPHHAFLLLEGSIKRRIVTSYELTQGLMLDDVIDEGIRLVKKPGSDKLHIYKLHSGDTLKFEFELQDDLGYPLRK